MKCAGSRLCQQTHCWFNFLKTSGQKIHFNWNLELVMIAATHCRNAPEPRTTRLDDSQQLASLNWKIHNKNKTLNNFSSRLMKLTDLVIKAENGKSDQVCQCNNRWQQRATFRLLTSSLCPQTCNTRVFEVWFTTQEQMFAFGFLFGCKSGNYGTEYNFKSHWHFSENCFHKTRKYVFCLVFG